MAIKLRYTGEEQYQPQYYDPQAVADTSYAQRLKEQVAPKPGLIEKIGGVLSWPKRAVEAITGRKYESYEDLALSGLESATALAGKGMETYVPQQYKQQFSEAYKKGVEKVASIAKRPITDLTAITRIGGKTAAYLGEQVVKAARGGETARQLRYQALPEHKRKEFLEKETAWRRGVITAGEIAGGVLPGLAMGQAFPGAVKAAVPLVTGGLGVGLAAQTATRLLPQTSKFKRDINELKFATDPKEREALGDFIDMGIELSAVSKGARNLSDMVLGTEDLATKAFREMGLTKFGRNVNLHDEVRAVLKARGMDENLAGQFVATMNRQALKGAETVTEDVSGELLRKFGKTRPIATSNRQMGLLVNEFVLPFETVEEAVGNAVDYITKTSDNIDILRRTGSRLVRQDFITADDAKQFASRVRRMDKTSAVRGFVEEIATSRGGRKLLDYDEGWRKVKGTLDIRRMKKYLADRLDEAGIKLPQQVNKHLKVDKYKFIKSPKGTPEFYATLADISTGKERTKVGLAIDAIFGGKYNTVLAAKYKERLRRALPDLAGAKFRELNTAIRKQMEAAGVYNVFGVNQEALATLGKEYNIDDLASVVYNANIGSWQDVGMGAITNKIMTGKGWLSQSLREINQKLIPTLRYKVNPLFMLQETVEPGIWAASRGIPPWKQPSEQMLRRMSVMRGVADEGISNIDEMNRYLAREISEVGFRRTQLASAMVEQGVDYQILNFAQEAGIKKLAGEGATDFVNRIRKTALSPDNRYWDEFNEVLAKAEGKAYEDVANVLYLPSSKSMFERTLNSSLAFWPISYQKRVTKEAADLLFNSFGGIRSGITGAALYNKLDNIESQFAEDNPSYAKWKDDHRKTLSLLKTFMPVDVEESFLYVSPISQSLALLSMSAFKGELTSKDLNNVANSVLRQTTDVGAKGSVWRFTGVPKEWLENREKEKKLEGLREAMIR